jgi:hypothetical protein
MIVNIAANRHHRSVLLQPVQNRYLSDIARMQNEIDPGQVFRQFGAEQAMSVPENRNRSGFRKREHRLFADNTALPSPQAKMVGRGSRRTHH